MEWHIFIAQSRSLSEGGLGREARRGADFGPGGALGRRAAAVLVLEERRVELALELVDLGGEDEVLLAGVLAEGRLEGGGRLGEGSRVRAAGRSTSKRTTTSRH